MNAITYIRLSDKDQSNYSLDSQADGIRAYCEKYKLSEDAAFVDNGESSYTFDRADFKKLEIYVKKFRPQYIIVFHLDRFSRNLAEALQKTRELLTKYNVRVRDITEPLELDDLDPNVFMIRSFRFMMAENELHRIRQRIKTGMKQGALNGRHLNKAPYGYKNVRDEQNKPLLVLNEEKAYHVQLIFKEYIAGNTIESVAKIVRLFGFDMQGNSSIQRILANPVYIGKVKVPESTKLAQGLHAPIVSDYDFYKAQELLKGRKGIIHQPKEDIYLRGVLRDYSGRLMTAGNSRSKSGRYYWYYVSKTNRQNYSASKIHDQFLEILELLSFSEREKVWFETKLTKVLHDRMAEQSTVAKKITAKLADVNTRIVRTEEKYLLQSNISPTTFKSVLDKLHKEQTELQYELLSNNTSNPVLLDKLSKLLPYLVNLKEVFLKLPLHKQQQFVKLVFDNSLSYYNECYRTPYLHPIFESKAALLKEKRLLIIEQPVIKMGEIPVSTPSGSTIELISGLLSLFVA